MPALAFLLATNTGGLFEAAVEKAATGFKYPQILEAAENNGDDVAEVTREVGVRRGLYEKLEFADSCASVLVVEGPGLGLLSGDCTRNSYLCSTASVFW